MPLLKRAVSWLPARWQQELKRAQFAMLPSKLISDEPEFARLHELVRPGDNAIDIGANVGAFTVRLSELVGPKGHVWSLEPVPQTFELLTANVARCRWQNVTRLNVAASAEARLITMTVPTYATGLANNYEAQITEDGSGDVSAHAIPIDNVGIPCQIALVKIDVEGHELPALQGMRKLLERDRPVLIIEGRDQAVETYLRGLGYQFTESPESPNRVFLHPERRSQAASQNRG